MTKPQTQLVYLERIKYVVYVLTLSLSTNKSCTQPAHGHTSTLAQKEIFTSASPFKGQHATPPFIQMCYLRSKVLLTLSSYPLVQACDEIIGSLHHNDPHLQLVVIVTS